MTSAWLARIPAGVGAGPAERPFQFDRPAEHGLAARSFGEGAVPTAEAREAAVDSIRDAVLAHYDPTDAAARWAGVEDGPGAK